MERLYVCSASRTGEGIAWCNNGREKGAVQMRAFHGKEEIKKRYLERVRGHRLNREIIHGYYWADGRGCAVGATIHGRDLFAYERELGIPASLAGLKDRIFEGMP